MGGFSLLLAAVRARLKMIEGIRAVEFLSIFVIGVLSGVLLTQIFKAIKDRGKLFAELVTPQAGFLGCLRTSADIIGSVR